MTMATRIAVMDAGWIQQVGKPDEVYEQPANRFVAEFIGSVNLFDGVIDEDLPEYVTVRSPLFPAPIYIAHGITCYEGQPVAFALRPEKVMIGKDEPDGHTNKAQGVIEDIAYSAAIRSTTCGCPAAPRCWPISPIRSAGPAMA